ncbi:MAG: hypothetical protein HDS30_05870 [Bacteroides sp.]|nr:hypothetical protein [Bacteroides sp.]
MFSGKSFKQSIGWIIAILGVLCYFIGYYFKSIYDSSIWPDFIIKAADVMIIGVVVGYLTGIAQWAGIFKKEIQDIIYGKEFLQKRNDIETIWYNVTKQMFKSKFADIHKNMLTALKSVLPSEDDISYYEDYDADSRIEWVDKDKGVIKCIDNYSMYIVVESEKQFDYVINKWTIENSENPDDDILESLEVVVDSKKQNDLITMTTRNGSEICTETKVSLSGKKRYFLQYSRVQQYNINDDYYIGFKAKYITNNLKVSLELPHDIEAIFIERGTVKGFQNVNNTKSHIKKIYKGVIFPKQGYIFALNVKK